MAYATVEDYKEYGVSAIEDNDLTRLLKIASDDIEVLIGGNRIYNSLSENLKKYVIRAVIAQVEYLYINGEDIALGGGNFNSVSIGSYSESKGFRSEIKSTIADRYAPKAFEFLYMAGLLYRPARLI